MRQQNHNRENGFTLIEILVVILIIGILAAIAVPVFLNQREKAAISAVKSDLKNAALSMESEAVGNKGKFLSYVPNYNPRSPNVRVSLNEMRSSKNKYCLIGKSEVYPDILFSYDSNDGGLLDKGKSCSAVEATDKSFSTVIAGKKALIAYARDSAGNGLGNASVVESYLRSYGFGTVDKQLNPDPSVYANYDLIVAKGEVWTVDYAVIKNLKIGYDNGARILSDGNDATAAGLSEFISKAESRGSGGAQFDQTGTTGLSPSFPYTFLSSSFGNDNWSCVLEVPANVVVVANSPDPKDPANKCITASAMNSGKGRWMNLNFAPMSTSSDTSMTGSSINWLTS